jgi:C-terminal processing protease CtpA/Prc
MRAQGKTGLRPTTQLGHVTVGDIRADSPAQRAGIGRGDLILAVDGRDVRQLGPGAVQFLMARPPGQKVSLTVQSGDAAPRTVSLTAEGDKK